MRLINWGYTKHRVKIIYKSGATHTFWTYYYRVNNGTAKWCAVTVTNAPILIGVDRIEAVYQTGISHGLFGQIDP